MALPRLFNGLATSLSLPLSFPVLSHAIDKKPVETVCADIPDAFLNLFQTFYTIVSPTLNETHHRVLETAYEPRCLQVVSSIPKTATAEDLAAKLIVADIHDNKMCYAPIINVGFSAWAGAGLYQDLSTRFTLVEKVEHYLSGYDPKTLESHRHHPMSLPSVKRDWLAKGDACFRRFEKGSVVRAYSDMLLENQKEITALHMTALYNNSDPEETWQGCKCVLSDLKQLDDKPFYHDHYRYFRENKERYENEVWAIIMRTPAVRPTH